MSSDGEVWIALTTCNTDSDVMMLFMTRLASALTKESADWRSSTVFLLDGVSSSLKLISKMFYLGLLSQVRQDARLLQASRTASHTERAIQLRDSSS